MFLLIKRVVFAYQKQITKIVQSVVDFINTIL